MKHLKKGRKLGRVKNKRKALLKIMLGDLLMKEKISTTEAKAKELKSAAEKIISQAKKINAGGQKETLKIARNLSVKLPRQVSLPRLKNLASRFAKRKGGCLRLTKLGQRYSDGAKMAVLELTEKETEKS